MKLLFQTLCLTAVTLVGCVVPRLSSTVQRYSKVVLLLGTGTLFGLCAFHLVPEVWQLGGRFGLFVAAGAGILYSFLHLFHIHADHEGHGADHKPHDEEKLSLFLFLGAMSLHCLADGMVLAAAIGFSSAVSVTIFAALLAHKSYESLSLSAILIEKVKEPKKFLWLCLGYVLALPTGVLLALAAQALAVRTGGTALLQNVAILITSVAVGSLLGCLVHDFLIPSYHNIRRERRQATWLVLGILGSIAIGRFI